MTNRNPQKQSEHDKVAEASARTWRRNQDNVVYTNPNGQQNFSVGGDHFPDVVATDRNNRLVAVEEIETEDTVTIEESKQWKEYAGLGVKFNLVVPKEKTKDAFDLSRSIGNINIQGYYLENGEVRFYT